MALDLSAFKSTTAKPASSNLNLSAFGVKSTAKPPKYSTVASLVAPKGIDPALYNQMKARGATEEDVKNVINPGGIRQGTLGNLSGAIAEMMPSTMSSIDEIVKNPLNWKGGSKEVAKNLYNNVVLPIFETNKETLKRIKDFRSTKVSPSEKVSQGLKAITGVANTAFTGITALFGVANETPILGTLSKLITVPFAVGSDVGKTVFDKALESMPLDNRVKANLKDAVGEVGSLAGMLVVGGKINEAAGDIIFKKKPELVKKFGEKDANTIIEKATEKAEATVKVIQEQPKIQKIEEIRPVEKVPTITKKLEPLAEEAKKYKTAEEFVNSFGGVDSKSYKLWEDLNKKMDISGKNFPTEKSIQEVFPKEWKIYQESKLKESNNKKFLNEIVAKNRGVSVEGIDINPSFYTQDLYNFYNKATKGVKESPLPKPIATLTKAKQVPEIAKVAEKTQGPVEALVKGAKTKEVPVLKEEFKSRVYERIKAENPALKGDIMVKRINLENDVQNAVKLVEKDKQKAYDIAMGKEEPSPDTTATNVNIVLSEKALEEGNVELYSKLISNRSLAQTRRGQEIVAEKGSVTDNSIARYTKELIALRLNKLGKEYLGGLKDTITKRSPKEKAVAKIDSEVAKLETRIKNKRLDVKTALSLLDKLTCV